MAPRQEWTFAELLDWHLTHGTRPSHPPHAPGRPWSITEFASALEQKRLVNERTIRNWRTGASLPELAAISAIEHVQFGDADHHANSRRELREAYRKSGRPSSTPDLQLDRGTIDSIRQLLELALRDGPKRSSQTEHGYNGIVRLADAAVGDSVFWSRQMKIFVILDEGDKFEIVDSYKEHPLFKWNPNVWVTEKDAPKLPKELEFFINVPEGKALRFLRLDFPPLKGHERMFGGEVLRRINAGETYTLPLTPRGKKMFWAEGVSNPRLTALYSIDSPNGVLSVVCAADGDI